MALVLGPLFASQATRAKRAMAERLRGGRGVGGRTLAQKIQQDGRPLGDSDGPGSIAARLEAGAVAAARDGWRLTFDDLVTFFHRGSAQRVSRPVAGYDKNEEQAFAREVADEAARQITREIGGRP
jgi:hypothetical protein